MEYGYIYDLVAPRKCSECGDGMYDGFVISDYNAYYCTKECLHKNFSEEEYLEMYDDGDGDSYWTEWELEDTDNEDVELKLEELLKVDRTNLSKSEIDVLNEQISELEHLLKILNEIDSLMSNRLKGIYKCTFCGKEDLSNTKYVEGYIILDSCDTCENDILNNVD